MPYPVLSCPVLSCPVLSCHVMSCHVMSCHVMSCHVMSCRVASRRVASRRLALRRIAPHRTASHHNVDDSMFICHNALQYIIARYVTAYCNVLCDITYHCVKNMLEYTTVLDCIMVYNKSLH